MKPRSSGSDSDEIPSEIPESELVFEASRSGGPGGQNVNKVETKVRLIFDYWSSRVLSWKQKTTLARDPEVLRHCTPRGHIAITSQRHRSQGLNKAAAIEKLLGLIRTALTPKLPRIKTRTPRASKRARLQTKTLRSQTKSLRRRPGTREQE
jgi:ribosome-associated protein